jgi:hypothetical protein
MKVTTVFVKGTTVTFESDVFQLTEVDEVHGYWSTVITGNGQFLGYVGEVNAELPLVKYSNFAWRFDSRDEAEAAGEEAISNLETQHEERRL